MPWIPSPDGLKKNNFQIIESKTVQMIFRRGGRPTQEDCTQYNQRPLKIVNAFEYLDVTLQMTNKSYRIDTQKSAAVAYYV